ncbi:MAG: transcriptional repressor NrdR [Christensenellaceae bacterium]|nr:transcriptional repressor NrdR [Christensenellaceae bacterium]
MKCIYCECDDSKVVDSRPVNDGHSIRRRRECLNCGKRFTTYEKVETIPVLVVKKDGSRELFDIEKIKRGVIRSCEKRPVSLESIERLASAVESQVMENASQEISTADIGEIVISKLKDLDEVAYVRFASVYRQFKDINTFMQELNKLLTER